MIQTSAAPALFVFYVFTSAVTMQYFLQMLQQEGWQIREYYNLLTQENLRWLPMIFALVPAAAVSMGYGSSAYALTVVYNAVMALLYWPWPRRSVRPEWTGKMKRLMVFWVLFLMLTAAILTTIMSKVSGWMSLGFSIVFLMQPMTAVLLELIDRPAARWLGRHFIRGSEDILSLHYDLRIIAVSGTNDAPILRSALQEILSARYSCENASQTVRTRMDAAQVIRDRRDPKLEYLICHIDAEREEEARAILETLRPAIQLHASADYYSLLGNLNPEGKSSLHFINGDDRVLRQFIGTDVSMTYGMDAENDAVGRIIAVDENGTVFEMKGLGKEGSGSTVIRVSASADTESDAGAASVEDLSVHSAPAQDGAAEAAQGPCREGDKEYVSGMPRFQTRLLGRDNITSLIGAACVSYALGVSCEEIRDRIARMRPMPHRLELMKQAGIRNTVVIDDAANEDALAGEEALDVLQQFAGMRILITDGFLRQGVIQEMSNRNFGAKAARICDRIILVGGDIAYGLKGGILESGYRPDSLYEAPDRSQAFSLADGWESDTRKIILLEAAELA